LGLRIRAAFAGGFGFGFGGRSLRLALPLGLAPVFPFGFRLVFLELVVSRRGEGCYGEGGVEAAATFTVGPAVDRVALEPLGFFDAPV
jgi:hypothetical protein